MPNLSQYTGSAVNSDGVTLGTWVGTETEYAGFNASNFENYAHTLFFIHE